MFDRASLKAVPLIYRSVQIYRYLTFQPRLAVAALRDWRDRGDPTDLPIPPARLRYRVDGGLDKEAFLRKGRTIAQNIRDLLAMERRSLESFDHVLDFGCGSGRVMRNFLNSPATCHLYGADIDPELVEWCGRNFPNARFGLNPPMPPAPFPDQAFDLIYAISVFTHLNQDFERAWLAELARIAKPGAILLLTVHGEHVYSQLAPSEQQEVRSKGSLFQTGATGWLKLDGLPDFYQTAYHTREYVAREWTREFELLRQIDRAINQHQDAVLLRRR